MLHQCTFLGLHDWSMKEFEKMGYMTLAIRDGQMDTVKCYIKGLKYLAKKINEKISDTSNEEWKKDLKEMHDNVYCLIETVKTLLEASKM